LLKNINELASVTENNSLLSLFDVKLEKRLEVKIYFICAIFLLTLLIGVTKKNNIMHFWQMNLNINRNDRIKTDENVQSNDTKANEENQYIVLDNLIVDADSYDVVDITIMSKADITSGFIYWKNNEDLVWRDDKSYQFNIGEVVRPIYHKHFSINVGEHSLWKGNINSLRFFFPQRDATTQVVKASIHRDFFLELLNIKYKRILIFLTISIFTFLLFFPNLLKTFSRNKSNFDKEKMRDEIFFYGLILLFGFVSFVPFDVYPNLRFYISSVPMTLPAMILPFLVLLYIVIQFMRREPLKKFMLGSFELSFLSFLVAAFISFKNAEFLNDSKILMIHFFIPTFLLCFLVLRFFTKELYLFRLIHFGIFFSTITAAYSLAEYIFNKNVLFDRFLITYNPFLATFSNYGPSYGSFIHPNVFGSYLILFIPLSIFMFFFAPSQNWKMYGFICSFIQILGLFAARSWGSFVSLIAVCIIILFKINRKIFLILTALVLCVVIITVAIHFKPYRDYINRAKEIGLNAPPFNTTEFELYNRKHWNEIYQPNYYSVYSRELMFKYIVRILGKYPLFGMGLNNFVPRFYEITDVVGVYLEQGPIINNQYIMLLGETGLIGFISFMFMIFFVFKGLFQKSKNSNSCIEKTFVFFCGVSITGFLLNIIFYDGFYWWAPNFCFYLITMSILAYSGRIKPASAS
jgi:O-antigen ligase